MRKCPRTLDKPILLFGLEVEDVAILSLGTGLMGLFLPPLIPGILFLTGWGGLKMLKKDKPQGFMLHWLYRAGMNLKGLLPPPRNASRYCAYHEDKVERKQTL